jgi:hypothetical protein
VLRDRRLSIVCVICLAAFAAFDGSAHTPQGPTPVSGSVVAAADNLYDAMLKASPTNLPNGVSEPQTAPVELQEDDRRSGVTGALQVTFHSSDPNAKINYVFFTSAEQAKAYAQRIDGMVRSSGGKAIFLPYAADADCAASGATGHMLCTEAVDRVVVISLAAESEGTNNNARGPVSLAGPLIKAALDHLATVKKASGFS